jgi:hypothetical protein
MTSEGSDCLFLSSLLLGDPSPLPPAKEDKPPEPLKASPDQPGFLPDRGISPAKGRDADFRPQMVRKYAGSHAVLEKGTIRGVEGIFVLKMSGYRLSQPLRPGQNVHEIAKADDGIQLQVAAADASAEVSASPQKLGGREVERLFSLPHLAAQLGQTPAFAGIQPIDQSRCSSVVIVQAHVADPES